MDNQGPLSCRDALAVAERIAQELSRRCDAKTFHGALSPRLIMLSDEGRVTVEDIDVFDDQAPLTLADDNMVRSLADHLAPEQARHAVRADGKAEIYSLGCILYFMLTGSVPFPGCNISECLLKHQVAEPRDIQMLRDGIPASVAAMCRKMMAKKPDKRYQSISELLQAISACRMDNG